MPSVFQFSRTNNEILQEILRVFASGRGSAREQWAMQAELLVEPVGWDALWKLSKEFCKKFEVRFPCIAYVSITGVDFENLSASVDVQSVQHETMSLPEMVHDVPLKELWPTEQQQEACINVATTAEYIDLLRFFYNNLWMPWDDQDDKVVLPATVEERMQLWLQIQDRTIPPCVARSITLLRNSAIDAHRKLQELDMSLCEVADDDDSLLPPNYISLCAELNARLDGIMAQWTLYENPLIREQLLAKEKAKWAKNRSSRNVVALWDGGSIFEFEEVASYLRARISPEQRLRVLADAEAALAEAPEELLLCSKRCQVPEVPLANISISSFNGCTVEASDVRSCLLVLSERCSLRDVALRCAHVATLVLARGDTRITNCVLEDPADTSQTEFAQGVVAMSGSKLLLEDCSFDSFYSAIVVHKGAQVELRNCVIKKCGVGIQMYSGAQVTMSNTTIAECAEQSIRYEAERDMHRKGNSVEGLNIQHHCSIGSGDLRKEVLVVHQDVNLM